MQRIISKVRFRKPSKWLMVIGLLLSSFMIYLVLVVQIHAQNARHNAVYNELYYAAKANGLLVGHYKRAPEPAGTTKPRHTKHQVDCPPSLSGTKTTMGISSSQQYTMVAIGVFTKDSTTPTRTADSGSSIPMAPGLSCLIIRLFKGAVARVSLTGERLL